MKIYIKNQQQEYIDVSFWSIVKANFLTSLAIMVMVYGTLFLIGLIVILLE